jgi:hypothetical protein
VALRTSVSEQLFPSVDSVSCLLALGARGHGLPHISSAFLTRQAGSIAIKDIERVWASAGKAKGRSDDQCMQIEGQNLPHSYTLAAASRKDRDAWVVALQTMAAAHSVTLQTE